MMISNISSGAGAPVAQASNSTSYSSSKRNNGGDNEDAIERNASIESISRHQQQAIQLEGRNCLDGNNGLQSSSNSTTGNNNSNKGIGAGPSKQHRLLLAARVKTITGKLLESHGAELRRTLFSLRQLFQLISVKECTIASSQSSSSTNSTTSATAPSAGLAQPQLVASAQTQEDSELASEFIESDGLECLMKVTNNADLIQQNYILKAVEQLIAYSSGMSGLMRHNQTVRWLYTLLGSQHRLFVATSIKLLLMFVEHNENNCLHLCRAIKSVEDSKGATTWATVIGLFKELGSSSSKTSGSNSASQQQQQQQDVALLIEAISLVNKTLVAIPDKDIYYDFVDPLEELGIERIGEKFSSLSPELRAQFEIYEKLLRANDTTTVAAASRHTKTMEATIGNKQQLPSTVAVAVAAALAVRGRQSKRVWRQQQQPAQEDDEEKLSVTKKQQVGCRAASAGSSDDSEQQQLNDSNEDNYESANEETGLLDQVVQVQPQAQKKKQQQLQQQQIQQQPQSRSNQVMNANPKTIEQQQQQSNKRLAPSSQQQRRHGSDTTNSERGNRSYPSQMAAKQQQNDLARGKQQRASISSCSSNDSYASYGSGYASGSGNSTDHEHKQKSLIEASGGPGSCPSTANNNHQMGEVKCVKVSPAAVADAAPTKSREGKEAEDDDEELEEEVKEEEEEEEEEEDGESSQLKQHLTELEQLTDELASRNIFGTTLNNPSSAQQSTSGKHFSSTIKSTSSNTSSVISTTDSNISSLSSAGAASEDTLPQLRTAQNNNSSNQQVQHDNSSSRSTSATPTSIILNQPNCVISSTATFTRAHITRHQSNGEMAHQAQVTRPTHQFAMPAINLAQQQLQPQPATSSSNKNNSPSSSSSSSSSSVSSGGHHHHHHHHQQQQQQQQQQQKQEPYYHNLFQWEQLVSKGVTRPLLINDLDFTDLRDEDDCDLLQQHSNIIATPGNKVARNQVTGEPLTINIPGVQQHLEKLNSLNDGGGEDSIDSGTGTGSPKSHSNSNQQQLKGSTPANAPPPMPPPPISPWFNTFSGSSRPQSQLMSSPSPPYDYSQQLAGDFNRDQSPANSTYSSYSRNSVCVPTQANTPSRDSSVQLNHYNTLQPVTSLRSASSMSSLLFGNNGKYANNKRKKTMKLFWKEVREDRSLLAKLTKKKTIWDEIKPVQVDAQKLEHLFESKAKDLLLSKSRNGLDGLNQPKVKTVLDAKRSNAINIGMTKLPPMRTIKSAILKMDSSIMNREGIEKILTTMMPSEEEKSRIIEAQLANPNTPLGTAEQFLLNLASISALEARLKLWAFQLDYAQIEKEVAEPLMDLKQAIEEIEGSETFRIILGTLLAIGNFLNSTNVKGFQIDYLEKVPEVKDTVHKHSLLHHLCLFIQEKYDPQSTSDLYSEFSAVNRASKVDYTEVAKNLKKMQQDCKASWDYLKIVAKHDGLANLMNTCGSSSSASYNDNSSTAAATASSNSSSLSCQQPKSSGKLNNLSKLSMITTEVSGACGGNGANNGGNEQTSSGGQTSTKQLKTKVSDFLTDCAERIMVLMVIHRRVMNRFQKLLVYLGCPSHQIKQTQPQQILKIINEFALEYRTKRERVREMLLKKQQCQHHHANRWQMNGRSRWAGSQQCINDSLGASNYNLNHRPCSTVSSCASSCGGGGHHGNLNHQGQHLSNQQQQQLNNAANNNNRACSPSGFSQISNYSDYLFDQSCCNSRQQSVTPVPSEKHLNSSGNSSCCGNLNSQHTPLNRRPHSMSISMFDLQNQQTQNCRDSMGTSIKGGADEMMNDEQQARQKDEQLRQLLGAGKSFDGACNELYQMSHWSSTMTRVPARHSGYAEMMKQRAVSMDCDGSSQLNKSQGCDEMMKTSSSSDRRRQSSYYRYLRNGQCINYDDESEQNSENEEILQSLVRTITAKSSHASSIGNRGSRNSQDRSPGTTVNGNSPHSNNNKSVRSKILGRFNCERKSFRRTLRNGIELSNVG